MLMVIQENYISILHLWDFIWEMYPMMNQVSLNA